MGFPRLLAPTGALAALGASSEVPVPAIGFAPLTPRMRNTISWQTLLADLALILFMVTAAAMGQPADKPSPPVAAKTSAPWSARGEPLAIWRAGPGAPPLGAWLASQATDPRQQLTLTLRYGPTALPRALASASALTHEAGALGRGARVLLEPLTAGQGGALDITASLAFDRPEGQ